MRSEPENFAFLFALAISHRFRLFEAAFFIRINDSILSGAVYDPGFLAKSTFVVALGKSDRGCRAIIVKERTNSWHEKEYRTLFSFTCSLSCYRLPKIYSYRSFYFLLYFKWNDTTRERERERFRAVSREKLRAYSTPIRRDPVEAGARSQFARFLTLWNVSLACLILQHLNLPVHLRVTGHSSGLLPRSAQMITLCDKKFQKKSLFYL